jgi:hypothetical protein
MSCGVVVNPYTKCVTPERVSWELTEVAKSLISLTTLSVTGRPLPSLWLLQQSGHISPLRCWFLPRSARLRSIPLLSHPVRSNCATACCPSLHQMIIDFITAISDNRGCGSNIPNHAINSIVSTIPVPVTYSALRSVPHVGKVLLKTHGTKLVGICKQYVSDFTNWQSLQVSSFPSNDVL